MSKKTFFVNEGYGLNLSPIFRKIFLFSGEKCFCDESKYSEVVKYLKILKYSLLMVNNNKSYMWYLILV